MVDTVAGQEVAVNLSVEKGLITGKALDLVIGHFQNLLSSVGSLRNRHDVLAVRATSHEHELVVISVNVVKCARVLLAGQRVQV